MSAYFSNQGIRTGSILPNSDDMAFVDSVYTLFFLLVYLTVTTTCQTSLISTYVLAFLPFVTFLW